MDHALSLLTTNPTPEQVSERALIVKRKALIQQHWGPGEWVADQTLPRTRGQEESLGVERMKDTARYFKIVTWSDEDQCFIGQCPGIIGPCCHGEDEAQVFHELCQIVEEWIMMMESQGKPLPPPTAGKQLLEQIMMLAA